MINSMGVCLGASTVSVVRVAQKPLHEKSANGELRLAPQVIDYALYPHDGDPKRTLLRAFQENPPEAADRVAATGRKFRDFVSLSVISEPQAVEYAYHFSKPPDVNCPAIVSAGGETFMVYVLNHTGKISNVLTGNKCASGTGEFFLQQLRRMDVSLDKAAQWAATESSLPRLRTLFGFLQVRLHPCHQQRHPQIQSNGRPLPHDGRIKLLELLKKVDRRNIMLAGGAARNSMMVSYLGRKSNT